MDAEGVAAPPVPSDSSAGSVPADIAVARASTAILAVLYLVVIALPVHWLVRALRACCEQRRQDRELVQELLPQASGSTNASPATSHSCLCSCEVCLTPAPIDVRISLTLSQLPSSHLHRTPASRGRHGSACASSSVPSVCPAPLHPCTIVSPL